MTFDVEKFLPPEVRAANQRVFGREDAILEVFAAPPKDVTRCYGFFGDPQAAGRLVCTDPPTTRIASVQTYIFLGQRSEVMSHTVACDRHAAAVRLAGDGDPAVVLHRIDSMSSL